MANLHDKENGPFTPRLRPCDPATSWGNTRMLKKNRTEPLVGHGRHFGRTVRTFCRVHTLLTNGLSRTMQLELGRIEEEDLTATELSEHKLYQELLALSPGLEERLNTGSDSDVHHVADMISKGIASARSDDTKSLKSAILDWITPLNQYLTPPLMRNVKTDRGFHHPRTGELLCPVNLNWQDEKIRRELQSGQIVPSGDLWPRFLYRNYAYDAENPWDGLLRSSLLVKAYRHVFTSPSSVMGDTGKATRSSNARIHGMTSVTIASLAYISTQVCAHLVSGRGSSPHDPQFQTGGATEVADLLNGGTIHGDSVIARIKERRRLINEGLLNIEHGAGGDGGIVSHSASSGGAGA
ncbi:hypothetical protein NMY22_g11843 [Coprinellus aureogranulatus]|nr:hypothetical protein NMY22_g11843 [Coprinellus aureogranulatus]